MSEKKACVQAGAQDRVCVSFGVCVRAGEREIACESVCGKRVCKRGREMGR